MRLLVPERSPNSARLDDYKRSGKAISEAIHALQHRRREGRPRRDSKAHQDDADLPFPTCENNLAEVLVLREKHAPVLKSQHNNGLIRRARGNFRNGSHVVALRPESPNDYKVATLVGQEVHGRGLSASRRRGEQVLMRHRVGCVGKGRPNAFASQVGIGVQQVSLCGSFAELPDDQIDGYPCPADHRLTHHDGGVDGDQWMGHWVTALLGAILRLLVPEAQALIHAYEAGGEESMEVGAEEQSVANVVNSQASRDCCRPLQERMGLRNDGGERSRTRAVATPLPPGFSPPIDAGGA